MTITIFDLVLNFWIEFPKQAEVGEVAQSAIDSLCWIGSGCIGFFVLLVFFILPYSINKGRFLEIRAGLEGEVR